MQSPRVIPAPGSRWRVAATAAALSLALATGVGLERFVLVDRAIGGQRHDALEDVEEYETLSAVYDLIREEYVLSGDMSDEELIYGAATGMLDALNDADHSYFMDAEETERNESGLASQLVGIGIRVNWEVVPPQIIFPLPDTPAFEAGILPGDEIIAIDGVDPSSVRDEDERSTMLRGEEGTSVTLLLRHRGEEELYEVTVTRQQMEINPVSWAMLPGDVLWLRLDGFPDRAAERLVEALEAGIEQGAEGVILDLRGNTGGWIDEAVAVASEFQAAGTVVFEQEFEDGDIESVETEGRSGAWREGELVVLVDQRTASSGELLSATLKDNNRAILVGVTTLGLGTTVYYFDLPAGATAALSVSLWITPDGDVMLNEGISPHVEVSNAPGVPLALPYMFGESELDEQDMEASGDDQLLTAYGIMLDLLEGSGQD